MLQGEFTGQVLVVHCWYLPHLPQTEKTKQKQKQMILSWQMDNHSIATTQRTTQLRK